MVQFGTLILLSRLLEPRAFGLLAMVAVIVEILDQFKDFGLSMATIQKPEIGHRQVSLLFWINTALGLALTLGLMALAPWIAALYGQPELAGIARWLALGFLVSGLTTQHWALLRRQMRFGTIAVIEVGAEMLAMATAVTAARGGDLLVVGLLGSAISAASIVAGLPFGPVGVAMGFALGTGLLRIPLCFWLAGRKGPVGALDLCGSALPSLVAAAAVFLGVGALRQLPMMAAATPFAALVAATAAAVLIALTCFAALPQSRRALASLRRLPRAFAYRRAGT